MGLAAVSGGRTAPLRPPSGSGRSPRLLLRVISPCQRVGRRSGQPPLSPNIIWPRSLSPSTAKPWQHPAALAANGRSDPGRWKRQRAHLLDARCHLAQARHRRPREGAQPRHGGHQPSAATGHGSRRSRLCSTVLPRCLTACAQSPNQPSLLPPTIPAGPARLRLRPPYPKRTGAPHPAVPPTPCSRRQPSCLSYSASRYKR